MPTLVFLLDVDNTLIDNDAVKKDYDAHLQAELGPALSKRFWDIYEEVRSEGSVVDIPRSLTLLREETPQSEMDEQTYQHVHAFFDNYPFMQALFPQTLETLRYLRTLGLTVIVSDGDRVFQPEKITNSGLADVVEGRVLIYVHKQDHIQEIMQRYPADHYIMIDDKPQILLDMKRLLDTQLTTTFVRQGHFANEHPEGFNPDISVMHIADLQHVSVEQFLR